MYNEYTSENDIAILKLYKSLIFNKYVQPACLPAEDYNYPVTEFRQGPNNDRTSGIVYSFSFKNIFLCNQLQIPGSTFETKDVAITLWLFNVLPTEEHMDKHLHCDNLLPQWFELVLYVRDLEES